MNNEALSHPVSRVYPDIFNRNISLGSGTTRIPSTQMRLSVEYVNHFPYDVCVLTPLNETILVKSLGHISENWVTPSDSFTVVETREWRAGKIKFDRDELFSVRDRPGRIDVVEDVQEEYFKLIDKESRELEEGAPYGTELALEIGISISRRDANKLKRPVYIKEANIVIFDPRIGLPKNFRHPLSDINRHHEAADKVVKDDDPTMLFKAHAVVNHSQPKLLYINIADNVFEIPIRENDVTSEDGVYITHIGTDPNWGKGKKLDPDDLVVHYTFDEARDLFGIYDNKVDAYNHYDLKATERKLKIQELTQVNNERAMEVSKLKHELDLESKQISSHYTKQDYETKRQYYSNHYDRKDTSEFISWVPKILSAVTSVAAGVWAWRTLIPKSTGIIGSLISGGVSLLKSLFSFI